uniref:Uncharacterized protein n=1 Tax=Oryza meridionalis TaxID=40149 RepID=A0A0E0D9U6_9ORYZ
MALQIYTSPASLLAASAGRFPSSPPPPPATTSDDNGSPPPPPASLLAASATGHDRRRRRLASGRRLSSHFDVFNQKELKMSHGTCNLGMFLVPDRGTGTMWNFVPNMDGTSSREWSQYKDPHVSLYYLFFFLFLPFFSIPTGTIPSSVAQESRRACRGGTSGELAAEGGREGGRASLQRREARREEPPSSPRPGDRTPSSLGPSSAPSSPGTASTPSSPWSSALSSLDLGGGGRHGVHAWDPRLERRFWLAKVGQREAEFSQPDGLANS